jgi:hypothetical protein
VGLPELQEPAAQACDGDTAHTACRALWSGPNLVVPPGLGLGSCFQARPFQCSTSGLPVATEPTAQLLMKGHFTFRDSGPEPRPCAHAGPTGRYFTAVFDSATFQTLEAGLVNRPPPVPLQTLGPVRDLS